MENEQSFSERKELQKGGQDKENSPEETEKNNAKSEELEPEIVKKQLEKHPQIVRETIMSIMKSGPMMPLFLKR